MDFKEDIPEAIYKVLLYSMGCIGQNKIKTASIIDYDLDRIYYKYNNCEYVVRLWNITENGLVEFSIYKTIGNYGEDIYSGICCV